MKLKMTKLLVIIVILFYVQNVKSETSSSSVAATVFDFLNNVFDSAPLQPMETVPRFMSTEKGDNSDLLGPPPKKVVLLSSKPKPKTANKKKNNTSSKNMTNNNSTQIIVDLNNPNVQLNDWMSISSPAFANKLKYPQLVSTDGSQSLIDLAKFERVNGKYAASKAQGSTMQSAFWFKVRGGYIYYSSTKEDINVLDAIFVKEVKNNQEKSTISNNTQTCFDVIDYDTVSWKICAPTKQIKLKWMCSLQKFLTLTLDFSCVPGSKKGKVVLIPGTEGSPAVERKRVVQPVIVIPMASKPCNDQWSYLNKGSDWECTCKEGMEQSPVDLPKRETALPSSLKPLFQYDIVSSTSTESTLDGILQAGEPVKIRYDKGAIRIYHANMGKIVALDGGVYIAEEISFHTPSQHKINGQQFDMEMQVVHYGRSKGDISKQIILSFLFKKTPGIYNKFIDKLDFFNLPNPVDNFRDINQDFFIPSVFFATDDDEVNSMQPFTFYTYEGSLTVPPCSERTTHYVSAEPIPLSNTVLTLFKEALKQPDQATNDLQVIVNEEGNIENHRDVQPLNGRSVFIYDHRKYGCVDYKPKKKIIEPIGHYEKVVRESTNFVYVNGEKPSGLPGSFVISESEAKGSR